MIKPKVDVVVPIYNSLDWLKICVEAVLRNTNLDIIGTVFLMNDCSNAETCEYLEQIERKWSGVVKVVHNRTNLGFLKTCNKAMRMSTSNYVLLLNSDCIVSENAIEKMMNAMQKDRRIGLLCPISSVAANLSYPIPDGMNFMQVNEIFGEQFAGMTFDACTVVGNCLMISRENINKVGFFDEIFGKGYTEETDYQFKSMAKGFKAKVLIDTYVFHQSRASFGESEEQLQIRKEHLDIFFERWGDQYHKLMEEYSKNDPIEYIKSHVKYGKVKNACSLVVTDIFEFEKLANLVNHLLFDHINVEMVTKARIAKKYKGIALFSPTIKRGFSLK